MNKKHILERLFSVIPEEHIRSVYLYGNTIGFDVDIFVLLKGDYLYNSMYIKPLDVTYVGMAWLPLMIRNCDPAVIEPLFNGKRLFGENVDPSRYLDLNFEDAPVYLLQCAEIFFSWSIGFAMRNQLGVAMQNIVHAYSYLVFAMHYWKNNRVLTYKEAVNDPTNMTLKEIHDLNKSPTPITIIQVAGAIHRTRELLTDSRIVIGCI